MGAYTQVSAGGHHTVLLRSDGTAVACGTHDLDRCSIRLPRPKDGMCFVPISLSQPDFVVQLFMEASAGILEATLVKQSIETMLMLSGRRFRVVLPDGRLASPHLTWQRLLSELTMHAGSGETPP